MAANSFLGTGWGFPPTFKKSERQVALLSDQADIESSLKILLSTRPGERVMRPDYGCNLDELVFESLTTTFKTYMVDLISTAILYHEPRIRVERIELDDTGGLGGKVLIKVDYVVRTTNSRFNFVYPFYKAEGTEIQ